MGQIGMGRIGTDRDKTDKARTDRARTKMAGTIDRDKITLYQDHITMCCDPVNCC